ncbi:uncharacterized protein LOC130051080 [Ostrea edulis]|uniref:uncharacterized protein LOC130051080 n=1 Tax=Ostrea edulis TaxID=37623 RepID=UPI0024AF11FF|nr:uncharacterized protein LOC130051080 [Ostrea edulis]
MNIVQGFYPVVSCHDEENITSHSSPSSEDVMFTHACSQTEDRNYKLETMAMKQRYGRKMQKLAREYRATRLTFGKKITDLRQKTKSTDKELSILQLQIPTLANERSALLLEVEAVDKQLTEEKYRYDTLMSKYKTFHSQLLQSGIAAMMSVNLTQNNNADAMTSIDSVSDQ